MYYCGLKLLAVVVQKTAFSHHTSEETGGHQVMKMLCDEGSDRSVAHLLSFDDEQRQSPVVRGTLAVLCPTFSDAGDGRGSVAVFTTFHTSYQIVILPFSSTPTVSISKSSFVKFGHRL